MSEGTDGASTTLRGFARGAIRGHVLAQAWLLFTEHGFDHTTVDQIAAASGMSRRTFFRYFPTKDALLVEFLADVGQQLCEQMAGRPADETAWQALTAVFVDLAADADEESGLAARVLEMLRPPSARASLEERRRHWVELLVPEIRRRDAHRSEIACTAVAASAVGCLDAIQEYWITHPGTSYADLLREAMAVVGPSA